MRVRGRTGIKGSKNRSSGNTFAAATDHRPGQFPSDQQIAVTLSQNNNRLTPKVSFRYDTLDSTNAAAVAAIHESAPPAHGDVFLSAAQTAGRGQGTNRWHGSPGANLTLSLVIYPAHLTADRLFGLSQLAALAIVRTVTGFLPPENADRVKVKWPNDVYVGHQKIAGILVQNGLRGSKVSWSVVGIGLNVGEINFPEGLRKRATSLRLLTGDSLEPGLVMKQLFGELTGLYPNLFGGVRSLSPNPFPMERGNEAVKESGAAYNGINLNDEYHRLLYRKDVATDFVLTATGQRFSGIIRGVDQFGRLRVEQRVGRESLFSVGEIGLAALR